MVCEVARHDFQAAFHAVGSLVTESFLLAVRIAVRPPVLSECLASTAAAGLLHHDDADPSNASAAAPPPLAWSASLCARRCDREAHFFFLSHCGVPGDCVGEWYSHFCALRPIDVDTEMTLRTLCGGEDPGTHSLDYRLVTAAVVVVRLLAARAWVTQRMVLRNTVHKRFAVAIGKELTGVSTATAVVDAALRHDVVAALEMRSNVSRHSLRPLRESARNIDAAATATTFAQGASDSGAHRGAEIVAEWTAANFLFPGLAATAVAPFISKASVEALADVQGAGSTNGGEQQLSAAHAMCFIRDAIVRGAMYRWDHAGHVQSAGGVAVAAAGIVQDDMPRLLLARPVSAPIQQQLHVLFVVGQAAVHTWLLLCISDERPRQRERMVRLLTRFLEQQRGLLLAYCEDQQREDFASCAQRLIKLSFAHATEFATSTEHDEPEAAARDAGITELSIVVADKVVAWAVARGLLDLHGGSTIPGVASATPPFILCAQTGVGALASVAALEHALLGLNGSEWRPSAADRDWHQIALRTIIVDVAACCASASSTIHDDDRSQRAAAPDGPDTTNARSPQQHTQHCAVEAAATSTTASDDDHPSSEDRAGNWLAGIAEQRSDAPREDLRAFVARLEQLCEAHSSETALGPACSIADADLQPGSTESAEAAITAPTGPTAAQVLLRSINATITRTRDLLGSM